MLWELAVSYTRNTISEYILAINVMRYKECPFMFLSPPVWQYDSVQRPACSQRQHSSAYKASAEKRRSRTRWRRLDIRCSWTVCFTNQLQPSLGGHSDCICGGQTWWAFKDRPAGPERRGEVLPVRGPLWRHGQDCVCGLWRCVLCVWLMQGSIMQWVLEGFHSKQINHCTHLPSES